MLNKKPKLLLLDEPLAALDKKLRSKTQLELTTLQKKLKITFVFVTHDQEEAMSLSDRMAIMKNGLILNVLALKRFMKILKVFILPIL